MINRRKFASIAGLLSLSAFKKNRIFDLGIYEDLPVFISTWNNKTATELAYKHLSNNPDDILDALEKGVNYAEKNENDTSVGLGGMPDDSGSVTLDACIMDHRSNAGSVCYLKDIVHAISVARKVMEDSLHVMLAGDGAQSFALANGFKKKNLLTKKAKKAYKNWKKNPVFNPKVNSERHDTIGMLALNNKANLSGACSTSGLAFKVAGRVGDSPIIGSGLFVDNKVGAACATGYGELIMKSCSSFLVVEMMKQGLSPENACKYAIEQIVDSQTIEDKQAALIAVDKKGRVGAYAIKEGFIYTVADKSGIRVENAKFLI